MLLVLSPKHFAAVKTAQAVDVSDQNYSVNDQVRIPGTGLYLVTEVRSANAPTVELTGIWIDGPHPAPSLG